MLHRRRRFNDLAVQKLKCTNCANSDDGHVCGREPVVFVSNEKDDPRKSHDLCDIQSALARFDLLSPTEKRGPRNRGHTQSCSAPGSTRLKAGTATKLVLNMLTTGTMVRLGKTYGNLMVDLTATNEKLRDRSQRIVSELTGLSVDEATQLLVRCDGQVKTAVVACLKQLSPDTARLRLKDCGGHLRLALK